MRICLYSTVSTEARRRFSIDRCSCTEVDPKGLAPAALTTQFHRAHQASTCTNQARSLSGVFPDCLGVKCYFTIPRLRRLEPLPEQRCGNLGHARQLVQ